jgi:hypothetical protein
VVKPTTVPGVIGWIITTARVVIARWRVCPRCSAPGSGPTAATDRASSAWLGADVGFVATNVVSVQDASRLHIFEVAGFAVRPFLERVGRRLEEEGWLGASTRHREGPVD